MKNIILHISKGLLLLFTLIILVIICLNVGSVFDSYLFLFRQYIQIETWSFQKWIIEIILILCAFIGTFFLWRFAGGSKSYVSKAKELAHSYNQSVYERAKKHVQNRNKLKPDFLDISISSLRKSSRRLIIYGILILTTSVCLAIYIFFDIKDTTELQIKTLKEVTAENKYIILIYYIVRGTALGALSTTTIFLLFKIANSCFDQATRFTKRRNGALFLKYIYEQYENKMSDDKIDIAQIMKFFEAWNQNVESAFTSIKVAKHAAGATNIELGKDGFKMNSENK